MVLYGDKRREGVRSNQTNARRSAITMTIQGDSDVNFVPYLGQLIFAAMLSVKL